MDLITLRDVQAAASELQNIAVRTRLLRCRWADRDGSRLWLKPENQQPVGAFKIRGAYHAMARLTGQARSRGVVTHSSGNHGQAVAYAARAMGVKATVVMPEGSVPLKVDRVRQLGAEVVLVPAAERLPATRRLSEERGLTVVPPYDHPDVIAGQGTVGLEILEDLPEVDLVLAPVGGGGLLSGVATVVQALRPQAQVIGVEPELAADARDSLHARKLVPWSVADRGRTVADGLRAGLSELTLRHIVARVADIVTVSEAEIRSTVVALARQAGITAEPSGAVAAAGHLHHAAELPPGNVVAIVSGGNIDPGLLQELLDD